MYLLQAREKIITIIMLNTINWISW